MKYLILAALLTGCATTGANYTPLIDNKGVDMSKFQADVSECQKFAQQRMSAASGAVAGAIAGALLGAFLAPQGYRNHFAGQGAVLGGLGAGAQANDTQESITKRCLSGRGYSVLN